MEKPLAVTSMRTPRRSAAVAALLAVALLVPAAAASPRASTAPGVVLDDALPGQIAAGPAPAVVAWDSAKADRAQVRAHLQDQGISFQMMGVLDMAVACAGSSADLAALTQTPGALSVWGDRTLTPALDDSVEAAYNGDPNAVWETLGYTGAGSTIAVIDTGIDASHPDLTWGEKTVLNVKTLVSHREILGPANDGCLPDNAGWGEDEEDTEVANGHGTHIASVAAGSGAASDGTYTGVAPGATLLGVSAVNTAELPSGAEWENVQPSLVRAVAAIDYVLIHGLEHGFVTKVALLGFTSEGLFDPFNPLSLAIQYLYEFGITPVLPAGNEGPVQGACDSEDTCTFNPYGASPYAVTVGASTTSDRTVLANFSSRGDPHQRDIWGTLYEYQPTLVAPGTDVTAARRIGVAPVAPYPGKTKPGGFGTGLPGTDDMDYQTLSGTSVAAAHVAGGIAVLQEAFLAEKGCYMTPDQVEDVLTLTATTLDYEKAEVGAGALDITAAITEALDPEKWPAAPSREPWMCPSGV